MKTDDEIWKEINADWYKIDTSDCGGENYDTDECDDEHCCFKHTLEWQDDVASRFQAARTKLIFEKLDKLVGERIEPSRLEEFYRQFSNAKDSEAALKVATAFATIELDAEKYEALKKEFGVTNMTKPKTEYEFRSDLPKKEEEGVLSVNPLIVNCDYAGRLWCRCNRCLPEYHYYASDCKDKRCECCTGKLRPKVLK